MQTFARDRRSVCAYSSSAAFEHEEEEEEEEESHFAEKSAESEARHYKNMLKDSANRPTVKNMIRRIAPTDPLGVDLELRGCSSRLYDANSKKK